MYIKHFNLSYFPKVITLIILVMLLPLTACTNNAVPSGELPEIGQPGDNAPSVDSAANSGAERHEAEPITPVLRRDFVTAINKVFGFYSVLGDEKKFADIPIESPDYLEFAAARRAGYLSDLIDAAEPDKTVTRAEAAAMLDRILEITIAEINISYRDESEIPEWAIEGARDTVASDILLLDETGAFRPADALTDDELDIIIKAVSVPKYALRIDEMKEILSFDGYNLTGRLSLPAESESIDKLVIYVHGTGPNTYLMRRQNSEAGYRFNVLDFYADKFVEDGTVFFSYSTRGVALGENPNPLAPDAVIDAEGYRTYTPQNVAMDLINIIDTLKEDPRLSDAKVILYGASAITLRYEALRARA